MYIVHYTLSYLFLLALIVLVDDVDSLNEWMLKKKNGKFLSMLSYQWMNTIRELNLYDKSLV